jgi:hypothetical protein
MMPDNVIIFSAARIDASHKLTVFLDPGLNAIAAYTLLFDTGLHN